MNEFGRTLTRVMNEQGIEDVEELVERLQPLMPADHVEVTVSGLEAVTEEECPALGAARSYDARFWVCLEDALGVSKDVTIDLMAALIDSGRR